MLLLLHGSGKTAVLVERIIHKILYENVNIDELLVVTFTNAAASEMRQRILDAIYNYLEEHPEDIKMQEQIVRMAKSNICTIHSFCLDVIRNYFYEIGISPNIRIGNQSEMELLQRQVLEDIFEEKYEKEEESFLLLIDTYTNYRGDDPLKELILNIVKTIRSNPFPEEWLFEAVEDFHTEGISEDFGTSKWGKILLQEIKEELEVCLLELELIKIQLSKFLELDKFTKTIEHDIQMLNQMKRHLNCWDEAYEMATTMKWETWPRD
ncbi:MAG: UvrD-helicase domain-containing protein, partial [Clostridia bacterium]|nr:UvrD-helicase domain-containing protein [Clostridia bacterium]